ncbi:TonB-dependent siderophore receptor [Methylosinus trichosporium]|uniref:TonB-dependent siderophore receptor n=1 Tax=Methylosinus trichosporium TaxID=426 RepID=UPI0024BAC16C|nr:TonB-dependent receptor [Methylosinus trichosporium]
MDSTLAAMAVSAFALGAPSAPAEAAIPPQNVMADAVQDYAIPAGSMSTALTAFAERNGFHLLYDARATRRSTSPGLSGRYKLREGLDRLLAGTGYAYRFADVEGNVSIVLAQADTVRNDAGAEALPTIDIGADEKKRTNHADKPGDSQHGSGLGGRFTGYNVTGPSVTGKSDISILKTPFSVQVVPRQALDDQGAISVQDGIVGNVSSVQPNGNLFYDGFTIRGLPNASIYRQNLKAPNITHLQTANLQSIEVLKGPAAMLFGRLEPGGVVNLVVKRPLADPYFSVQEQAGSWGRTRTSVDATGPLTDDKSWLYRMNVSFDRSDSFRDFVFNQDAFVAPTLTYQPTEQFRLNIDAEYQNEIFVSDYNNVIPAVGNRPANIPISRYLQDPAVTAANPSRMDRKFIGFDWTYEFDKDWSLTNRFSYTAIDWAQRVATFDNIDEKTGDITRGVWDVDNQRNYLATNLDLHGKFETGPFQHSILVGFDYFKEADNDAGVSGPVDSVGSINMYAPTYSFSTYAKPQNNFYWRFRQSWKGVYAQDYISFLNDKVHLLLGGRYDWANYGYGEGNSSYAQTTAAYDSNTGFGYLGSSDKAFSPRVGVVLQPTEWVSFYGSYSQSFGTTNGLPVPGQPPFRPQKGEQFEGGVKAELLDGRLTASMAYFAITKSGILQTVGLTPYQTPVGEIESNGFEVDIAGRIDDNWSLIGNYSHDTVRITKDANVANIGRRLINAPIDSGNIWVKYDADGEFKGLSLGGGLNVVGERQGDNANTFQLPAYASANAMIAYSFQPPELPWTKNVTVQLNVKNLFDSVYYVNSQSRGIIMPGAPRTFLASIRAEF